MALELHPLLFSVIRGATRSSSALRHSISASRSLSPALHRFLPSSRPPLRPSPYLLYHSGSGRVAKETAVMLFLFHLSIRCPLVSYTLCVNHILVMYNMKRHRRNHFHPIWVLECLIGDCMGQSLTPRLRLHGL